MRKENSRIFVKFMIEAKTDKSSALYLSQLRYSMNLVVE